MKVILLEDVKGLGERGDTVNVANGYARNYLLPRNRALRATPTALTVAKELSKSAERREGQIRDEAVVKAEKLKGLTVTLVVNVSETGKLFGSVTAGDIAKKIAESGVDVDVDRHDVLLNEPIKSIGQYTVPVKIFRDVRADVDVWVTPSEESKLAASEARARAQASAAEAAEKAEAAEAAEGAEATGDDTETAGGEGEDAERAATAE